VKAQFYFKNNANYFKKLYLSFFLKLPHDIFVEGSVRLLRFASRDICGSISCVYWSLKLNRIC